jgi:hypothetical protein
MKILVKVFNFTLTLTLTLVLVSCAQPLMYVQSSGTVDPSTAYVAGMFSGTERADGFGLELRRLNGKGILMIPFFEKRKSAFTVFQERPEKLRVVAVPPGEYEIRSVIIYVSHSNEKVTTFKLSNPIKLLAKAGKVEFLGRFFADQRNSMMTIIGTTTTNHSYQITPMRITKSEVVAAFRSEYPNFSEAQINFE